MKRNSLLLAATLLSAGNALSALPATEPVAVIPGWIRQAPPAITPAEARARWTAAVPSVKGLSSVEATPEIEALARALRNDPRRIFDYVRNRIDYEPTYGSVLGATATYYAGKANDCDQASLLIALLRQAGFQARYAIGDVTYTPARLAAWLGADESVAQNVLLNGGVPLAWGGTGWQITRIWVEASLDDGWVPLDPAMTEYHEITPGVSDWNEAMNHVPSAFLTRAQIGATVDEHSARNLNEGNIRADLCARSTSLVGHVRANLPAAGSAELVGGRRILETELGAYPTTLPFAVSVSNKATYDTLPQVLQHTLSVTHVQTPANTHTFNTCEIAGRRLTMFWNGANTVLLLEGLPVFTFSGTPSNAAFTVRVQLDHPCGIGQSHDFPLTSGVFSYAIACDFDGVSPGWLAMRRERLERTRQQGGAAGSDAVRGEALSILGLEWFRQVALFEQVVDRLNSTRTISHHRTGIVGQGPGFFVDMPLMYGSPVSVDGLSDPMLSSRAQSLMSSAFEHGVLQQRQDHAGWDSVSTVRLLQEGNATSAAIYLANAANWDTGYAVRGKLLNYSSETLSWLDAIVAAGYDLVLPQNGQLQIGSWRGTGFIQHLHSGGSFGMGMIISGGYAGGYTAQPAVLDTGQAKWAEGYEPWQPKTPMSKDPVDMATGAFLYEMHDFSVGPAAEPMGLALVRAYSSAASLNGGSLGYGWAHNHGQAAVVHSSGAGALGCGGAVNAASAVASAHILLDLLAGTPDALAWSTASLVSKWTMDKLIDNAVTVHAAAQTDTYLKLADGSFNSPPGGDGVLVPSGSGFELKDRQGTVRTFGASGAIAAQIDPNGNAMTYAYDGSGRLTGVTDCLGKTLTFSYNGNGLLTNASHGGCSVQYTYSGGNLVNFRDAAGADWRYAYDASNRLAAVFKATPASVAQVTNVYDSFGRVKTQTDALGNTSAFYFSGYRNIEALPDGSQTVYMFGRDWLFTAREDATGNRVAFDYDGLGRLVRMTDRLGDETVFAYHPVIARVVAVTNAQGDTSSFTYSARPSNPLCYDLVRVDYPGGVYETFGYDAAGNATAHRDGAGGLWSATYNARGQRLSLTNPQGGVETRVYHADGTLTSVADGDVSAATFQYDAFKRLSRITHSGGAYEAFVRDALGRATSYADAEGRTSTLQYDANGRVLRLTDPSSRATSFAYDAMENLVAITNRLGAVTTFAYDSLNRRVGKTDATGVGTTFAYDARGRLTTMARGGHVWATVHDDEGVLGDLVTPDGSTNSIATDRLGMVTGFSDALGQSSTYTRDAAGRVTAVIDPCGRTNGYAADGEGRLTGVTLPSLATATYVYDGNGFLNRITDLNGRLWNLTRTAMGRRLTLSDPLARVCSYGYDDRGRLASIAYPDNTTLSVTLDDVGQTRRLLYSGGPDLQFDYDANHRLTTANGIVLGRNHEGRIVSTTDGTEVCGAAYDDAGRLTAADCDGGAFAVTYAYAIGPGGSGLLTGVWDNVTSARVSFGYDLAGRLRTLSFSNGETVTYTWNASDRLVRVQSGVHVDETVAYDASGRITGKQRVATLLPGPSNLPALGLGVTVDAASQLDTPGYVHDARGRVTATPEHALAWDGASRVLAIDGVALAYNGLGQVRTRTADGTTTRLLYNHAILSAPQTAELNDGTGQMLRYYVWTPGGRLLYAVDAAAGHAVRFYHFDSAGSTLALTDMAGNATDAYAYDPYGRIVARTGVNPQPFTFVGAWGVRQEGGGGLYQMRARYYDAKCGRFLSPEPLWPLVRDPKTLNPYAYAGGDPVRFVDPTGFQSEVPLINEQHIRDQVNDLMQELEAIQQDITSDRYDYYSDQSTRNMIYRALSERYGDEDQTETNQLLAWLAQLDAAREERAKNIEANEARIRRLVNGKRQAAVKLLEQVAQWKKVLLDIRKNDIESAAYHLQVGERDVAKEDMARAGKTEQDIQGVNELEYRLNDFLQQDSLGVR